MKRVLLAIGLCLPVLGQNLSIGETQSFQARDAGEGDEYYQKGLSALDSHDWDKAIAAFGVSALRKIEQRSSGAVLESLRAKQGGAARRGDWRRLPNCERTIRIAAG